MTKKKAKKMLQVRIELTIFALPSQCLTGEKHINPYYAVII